MEIVRGVAKTSQNEQHYRVQFVDILLIYGNTGLATPQPNKKNSSPALPSWILTVILRNNEMFSRKNNKKSI